jgi:uncharacterized membrane protein YdjX (TVP38/TMEM64 family)
MKKLSLVILFFIILFVIAEFTGIRNNFTISYIQTLFLNNLIISSLLFITLFSLANLIQIPGWIFLVASITSLGKIHGPILTYISAVTACIVSYLLVGQLGGNALQRIDNNFLKKTLKNLNSAPLKNMITLRIIFQTFPPLNYSLALSGVKLRDYTIACIIGLPFPILILTIFFEFIFKRFI